MAALVELFGDEQLRQWSGFREVGAVYLLPEDEVPAESIAVVRQSLPDSIEVTSPPAHFRGLPFGCAAVVERGAGYYSPAALRTAVLRSLSTRDGRVTLHRRHAVAVTGDPAVCLTDGVTRKYDAVVHARQPVPRQSTRIIPPSGWRCGRSPAPGSTRSPGAAAARQNPFSPRRGPPRPGCSASDKGMTCPTISASCTAPGRSTTGG
ncbi:hypothetical protein [Plantactinospora sp. KBS50]|uniref:hypothetical protein n=1 Tax=Plantactinospora sp. KBS50 TaxID=2024580 RepID=UPI0012FE4BFA|nr:hypothetical protein [Plantactinospora sp. KBS50]